MEARRPDPAQTELFAAAPAPASPDVAKRAGHKAPNARSEIATATTPVTERSMAQKRAGTTSATAAHANASKTVVTAGRDGRADGGAVDPAADRVQRQQAYQDLLDLCAPVRAGGKAAAWLKSHRVFRKTWEAQGLRHIENYPRVAEGLLMRHPLPRLVAWGLFNKEGHLRFSRHTLIIPWRDGDRVAHLQARAPDPDTRPPELAATGPVPCPYNAPLLDSRPGRLYLAADSLDALTLLEAGFPAVGLTGDHVLKPAWLPRFREKSVFVAFDADVEGEAAAARVLAALAGRGIDAHRLRVPPGKHLGTWLAGR